MPIDSLLLLDTNVVLHLVRNSGTGQALERQYEISGRRDVPIISIVTVGEAMAFAEYRGWGESKRTTLSELLHQLVVVDIRLDSVLRNYALIHSQSLKAGKKLGDNDKWIAATAAATGAYLLTTDRDFEPLLGAVIQGEWFDPTTK